MGPDGTVWVQSGADAARHQDDLDSCYFDAQGQVAFTSYSNRASRATFRSEAGGLRLAAWVDRGGQQFVAAGQIGRKETS